MIVNCDKCNTDFEINFLREKFRDFKRLYFICPNCKEECTVCFEDEQTEKIKSKINKYKIMLSSVNNQKHRMDILNIIKKEQNKMKKQNEKLKKRYEKKTIKGE